MVKYRSLSISALVLLSLASPVGAVQGKWVSEFGQGNYGYFIDKGKMRLYIGCGGASNASSDITLGEPAHPRAIKIDSITVGGKVYSGSFDTDNSTGKRNFVALVEALKRGPATVKYEGASIDFPVSNAAKELPKSASECG